MRKEILRVSNLKKVKRNRIILEYFNMNVYEGEVLGILGLHDSGKSTLLNILAGNEKIDGGMLFFEEEQINTEKLKNSTGIALIQKKYALVGNLSVLDNIFILRKHFQRKIFIPKKLISKRLKECFAELHINVSTKAKAWELNKTERYIVEIAKAYILGAKLILIDDFSAEHTMDEHIVLHNLMEYLKKKGVSFILVGNHMENLQVCADRILFLVKGKAIKAIKNFRRNQIDINQVMLENDIKLRPVSKSNKLPKRIVFQAENISGRYMDKLTFYLREGEIVAIVDFFKETNMELYHYLQNPEELKYGKFSIEGQAYNKNYLRKKKNGIVFTDFRVEHMIVEPLSVCDNLCLSNFRKISISGFVKKRSAQFLEKEFIRWYGDDSLYGQQDCYRLSVKDKLAIYLFKLQLHKTKVLFCKDPSMETDYVTQQMIEKQIYQMALEGTAVCIFTSNIEKMHHLVDRCMVVSGENHNGKMEILDL